ncbi:hypothetical protein BS17DRAFT_690668 [Gyrodon lividus]|nr:hypothetical protein BS17DRAFT_690668 [Gyrodon lividus]
MPSSDADRVAGRTSTFLSSSRSGVLSPLPSASLTEEHVTEALTNSPDNGATLDFTHKSLTDVGEDGAERLATVGRNEFLTGESSITRIALGYNRLATLPTAFALVSRLRYLNLKNNSFSVFPDVLTVMPSLEILDISRNKIKRLPTQPGTLANLHVFCISRNKITRLPAYLGDFGSLNVLKLDHNPIEWPPKALIEVHGPSNDSQAAKDWILSLQRWLRENSHPQLDIKPKPSVDSFMSERAALNNSIIQSWARIGEEDYSTRPPSHARTFSIDAQFPPLPVPGPSRPPASSRFERPPPLMLAPLPTYDPPHRSSSPETYLPTPEESASSTDDDHTAVPDGFQHGRNSSFTRSSRDRRPALFGRKSIPDLSTSTSSRPSDHGSDVQPPESGRASTPTSSSLTNGESNDVFIMPSPLSHRQGSSSSSEGSSQHMVSKRCATTPPSSASPTSAERPHPVPDTERHAYFKRLSALPANTISNNIPASLRSLVECARSLFFAVSQVYQALSHYITYTINQKLSSVLRKVTDPAYTYMVQLNGALERFDAMAKRTTPPSSLCRALVESSRDTAAVFGKAIAMLSLQLKILASKDDDRYMRSLVLIFYGAVAEISHTWQSMAPHIEAITPHLVDHRRIAAIKSHGGPATASLSPDLPPASAPAGYSPFAGFQHNIPIARSRPAPNVLGRARTTRRHAGSFSSKDVEIGKSLPSYDLPPPPVTLSSSTPSTTLRAGQRHPAMSLSASTSSLAPSLMAGGTSANVSLSMSLPSHSALAARNHSRQTSQASLMTFCSSSSPQVPIRRPTLDIPQSRTLVDKDALDSMEAAVDSAPAVWEMMKEIAGSLSETPGTSQDIHDSIDKAKDITERLRASIVSTRAGDPTADRKALREDAHVFVKTVVKLSNVIKTYGSSHALFPDLRAKMVSLTNATQEFVMLLHVSSFSPSATPRQYLPMTKGLVQSNFTNGAGSGPEDSKLGANLSRSRSTQQPKTLKLVAPWSSNLPRSALPNQSQFHITVPQRYVVPASSGAVSSGNGDGSRGDQTADEG